MHDLLAIVLVLLVVLTAVASVYAILTGQSEEYSESNYPRSQNHELGNGPAVTSSTDEEEQKKELHASYSQASRSTMLKRRESTEEERLSG